MPVSGGRTEEEGAALGLGEVGRAGRLPRGRAISLGLRMGRGGRVYEQRCRG